MRKGKGDTMRTLLMMAALAGILFISSNAEARCKNLHKMIRVSSDAISETLTCFNRGAVLKDVAAMIPATQLCKVGFKKVKEKHVCLGVGAILSTVTITGIPDRWGCTEPARHLAKEVGLAIREECYSILRNGWR